MPIYEYQCADCDQQFSLFFAHFSAAENREKICPACGGQNLKKLISQVAVVSNAPDVPASLGKKEESPADLARIMRNGSSKPRQDFGQEFQEVAHRLEKGENPKNIERSLRKRAGQPTEDIH